MSTTAGAWSETTLNTIRAMADRMSANDRIKLQYIPRMGVVEAVNTIMTADISVLKTNAKDYTVDIEWMNACDITTEECTNCTIGGNELSSNIKQYTLDQTRCAGFTTKENTFYTNDFGFEESVAKGMLRIDAELCNYFQQQMVTYLNTFVGVNTLGTTSKGVVSGTTTYVDAPYWTPELAAYIIMVAEHNRLTNPILLTGRNFFEQSLIAEWNNANADGKGKYNMIQAIKMFRDIYNIEAVNSPLYMSYLLSMGSVAWASKSYETEKVRTFYGQNTQQRWAESSRFLPGLTIEWAYDTSCDSNNHAMVHNYSAKIKFGIFNNPTGCDETNTGVLTFTCGTAS